MKKYIIIPIAFLIIFLVFPTNLEAKTLNQLRSELSSLQAKKAEQDNKKALTQKEVNAKSREIAETRDKIAQGREKIAQAEKDIAELNIKIEEKTEETKELLKFMQLANGENAYLEYAFGAESYTDLIYRMSIVEQLSEYNKKNIEEMNDLIEQNKKLQADLKVEEEKLKELQNTQESQLSYLGDQLAGISEITMDISEEISAQKAIIKIYEDLGCEGDQDVLSCVKIPQATGLYRPLTTGVVTSGFGNRFHPTKNYYTFHNGIDIGVSEGTPVYPAADGMVAAKTYSTCGGNSLYIHHTVKGVNYTTQYTHLLSTNVSVGSIVTKDTVIAYSGGYTTATRYGGYDTCTTGGHLHFAISYGHYLGSGYSSYSRYLTNCFDARNIIYFPTSRWYSRY